CIHTYVHTTHRYTTESHTQVYSITRCICGLLPWHRRTQAYTHTDIHPHRHTHTGIQTHTHTHKCTPSLDVCRTESLIPVHRHTQVYTHTLVRTYTIIVYTVIQSA